MPEVKADFARVDKVQIVEVIRLDWVHGLGIEGDPVRRVTEFWDKNGNLLVRQDPNVA